MGVTTRESGITKIKPKFSDSSTLFQSGAHLARADFKIKVKQIAHSTVHFDQWNPLISKM